MTAENENSDRRGFLKAGVGTMAALAATAGVRRRDTTVAA